MNKRLIITNIVSLLCQFCFTQAGITQDSVLLKLKAGDDIQAAINKLHKKDGGTILLAAGTYVISKPIELYSNIILRGELSRKQNEMIITPADARFNEPILFSEKGIHDVLLENIWVKGNLAANEQTLDPTYHTEKKAAADKSIRSKQFGIILTAGGKSYATAQSANIIMRNVEVSNCAMGIHVKGAKDVLLQNMKVHDNGLIQKFFHNVYFRRVFKFTITHSEMYNSPTANGINVSQSEDVTLTNNYCHDNYFRGLRVEGEQGYVINNITITGNKCINNGDVGIRACNIMGGIVSSNISSGNHPNGKFSNVGNLIVNNNTGFNSKVE